MDTQSYTSDHRYRVPEMALTPKEVEAFRELEESIWRQDPAGRDRILSSDFQEFCRFGDVYDRDHLIGSSTDQIEVEFPFDAFEAEALSEDVVLITYENTVTANGSSQRARRSSIWVLTDGEWRLRFQQATTLSDV